MSTQFIFAEASSLMRTKLTSHNTQLEVIQHPKMGRVAMAKDKDRKPIDPPPIVQLKVNKEADPNESFLQSSAFFIHCTLIPLSEESRRPGKLASNGMGGTPVSSLHRLKNQDNKECAFFVFGDISIKEAGDYRLEFHLFELRDSECCHIDSVQCNRFTVYTAKNFPGLEQSTFLTRMFSDQGVRLRVRKEPRSTLKKNGPASDNYQKKTYSSHAKNENGKRPRSGSIPEATQHVPATSSSDPSPVQHHQENPRLMERSSFSASSAGPSNTSSQDALTSSLCAILIPPQQSRTFDRSQGDHQYFQGSPQSTTQPQAYYSYNQAPEATLSVTQSVERRQTLSYTSPQHPIPAQFSGFGNGFNAQYPGYGLPPTSQFPPMGSQYGANDQNNGAIFNQIPPVNDVYGSLPSGPQNVGSGTEGYWQGNNIVLTDNRSGKAPQYWPDPSSLP
ncbi:developmental regulator [Phlyctema vagabunda]|uniref:Developmental regulator n=1 Tax=Phlyctema vagabunda TaxID=108571 RepID=A0ABR4PKH0_9HELO